MTDKTTVTTNFKSELAAAAHMFVRRIPHFLVVADHSAQSGAPPVPVDSVRGSLVHLYDKMIFGKRIEEGDSSLVVRRVDYQTGRPYATYDDVSDTLPTDDFFVVANASSYYHVWKCLDNNYGANSTYQPEVSDVSGANVASYRTPDGYLWKYVYSYDSATHAKFATADYVPLVVNTDVRAAAVGGAIDVIAVEDQGRGYDNWLTGEFGPGDARVGGSMGLHRLSTTGASTTNNFYVGCVFYLTGGPGSGQYSTVADHVSNSSGCFVRVDPPFATSPSTGTTYELTPGVRIVGDGSQTIEASARCLVNAYNSNSVYRVEMLERGRDYLSATASVVANPIVGVLATAALRPIAPPRGGHGFDPAEELFAGQLCLSVSLANTEGGTVPATSHFNSMAIVRAPQFANVRIEMTNRTGDFLVGEAVYRMSGRVMAEGVSVHVANVALTGGTRLDEKLTAGDLVFVVSADQTHTTLTSVNAVTNSSALTLATNATFTDSAADLFLASNLAFVGFVRDNSVSTRLWLSNVQPYAQTGDVLTGASSGARGTVTTVYRSNRAKGFETFVQMTRLDGSATGTFQAGETVRDSTTGATGLLHSTAANSALTIAYLTETGGGLFSVGDQVVGDLSGAVLTVTDKYEPETVPGSGSPVRLENVYSVTRSNTQTETVKVTVKF